MSRIRKTPWRSDRALSSLLGAIAIAALAAAAPRLSRGDEPCASPIGPSQAGAAARATVTILHTNDWHGYAFAERPKKRGAKNGQNGGEAAGAPTGGIAACAVAVAKIRAERPGAVLVLDAGDLLSGHPAAELVDEGVPGLAFVRLWSTIGFDAWTIGNHDLDHGIDNLRAEVAAAKAQLICANLSKPDGSGPLVPSLPWKIFEVAGLKVGVVGLVTGELPRLLRAEVVSGLKVAPPEEAARPLVEKLRPEVDLLVGLTHLGIDDDRKLARAVPGFDAIVGGHSHTLLKKPVLEGSTLIVQAGAHGRQLGRLDLTVEARKLVAHEYSVIALPYDEASVPKETLAASKALEARVEEIGKEIVGETAQPLRRGDYYRETECGSFVADAIRRAAGTEIGFINSGGLRAEFPQGKVTRAQLLAVLPFDDELASFEVSGAELAAIIEHNAKAALTRDHGILQVSGLRYRYRRRGPEGVEVISIEVGGKPLDPARKYTCATNRFLAFEQAEKYFGLKPAAKKLEIALQAAVAAALKNGPVERPDRGRIRAVGAEAPAPVSAGHDEGGE
jgi:2',3'-cyclic-nucleotide 2'-phosphodiesterase (5'-nucleotidase family)